MAINSTPDQVSLLIRYIDRRMAQGIKPSETACHLVARRSLQGLGIAVAGAGKYPFVSIAKKAGGNNEVYGIALAYGNTASFAALISWALLNIIDGEMRPLTKEEAALLRATNGHCSKAALLPVAILVGLVSQTPFAYLAYVYNGEKVEMPVMMMLSDSWFPTYSTYLSLKRGLAVRHLTSYEETLSGIRRQMIALLEGNRALLENPETRVDYVAALEAIRNGSALDKPKQYLKAMLEGRVTAEVAETQSRTACRKVGDAFAGFLGIVAFLSNMGAIGYVSYLGWHQVYANPGFDGTFAALAVGANLYLNSTSVPRTAIRLYNLVKDVVLCRYQPTLADQLAPKMSFALKVLGLATAALSYGPSVQISHDYFDGDSEDYGICHDPDLSTYMEVANSCATVCLVATAILDIVDQIVALSISKLGDKEAVQLMELNDEMKRFAYILANSPLFEFALLLKLLPQPIFDSLLKDTEVTRDNLEAYIADHSQDLGERQPLMIDSGGDP